MTIHTIIRIPLSKALFEKRITVQGHTRKDGVWVASHSKNVWMKLGAPNTTTMPIPRENQLSEATFSQVIEELTSQFVHQPPILVRDSPDIVGGNMSQASGGSISGATYDGRIYIFRDAIATHGEIVSTLWHELVHYGLRRFLDKSQYVDTMQQLYQRDMWIKHEADTWLSSGGEDVKEALNMGHDYALARGVDEALATLAETNQGEYRINVSPLSNGGSGLKHEHPISIRIVVSVSPLSNGRSGLKLFTSFRRA